MPTIKFNDFSTIQGWYNKPDKDDYEFDHGGKFNANDSYWKKLKEKMTELGKAGQAKYVELDYKIVPGKHLKKAGVVTGLKFFVEGKEAKWPKETLIY